MRATWLSVGTLFAATVSPAAGQVGPDPVEMARSAVEWSWGRSIAQVYSGKISWTWSSGDAREAANVTVTEGVTSCSVTYTNSEGTRSATGPGLLEIMLGLAPDSAAPSSVGGRGGLYAFQVACPDPQYTDGVREARWAHSQESYKQPGGAVTWNPKTKDFMIPTHLIGSWTIPTADGSETTRLVWDLCLRGQCSSPPKP